MAYIDMCGNVLADCYHAEADSVDMAVIRYLNGGTLVNRADRVASALRDALGISQALAERIVFDETPVSIEIYPTTYVVEIAAAIPYPGLKQNWVRLTVTSCVTA